MADNYSKSKHTIVVPEIHSTSKHKGNLRCVATGRMSSIPTGLLLNFNRILSGNEIRELRDKIDEWLHEGEPENAVE